MNIIKALSVPAIIVAIAVVVCSVFASLEPVKVQAGEYSSKAEAIAASFK